MINLIESKMQTYEYDEDVPLELQEKLKRAEYKSREVKFAYKLLLIILIPWIWLCVMSYYMIAYIDGYASNKAQKKREAISDLVIKDMVKLESEGNQYALLYLAEHGNFEQRSNAQYELSLQKNEDALFYTQVISRKSTDAITYNLEEDLDYIRNLISYAAKGHPKAIDELLRVELKLRLQKNQSVNTKRSLGMIEHFKKSIE